MKLAIMQPYFFPYIGYFDLIASVDKFVFYDDVNFIKNGWINRNRLYLSGDVRYFTAPLSGASSNSKIFEVRIQPRQAWTRKLLESIRQSYAKAPNFIETFDLLRDVLDGDSESVSSLAQKSVQKSAERLGMLTNFIESSSIYENSDLKGTERVLDICLKEGTKEYINLPGGKSLYDETDFLKKGIKLSFTNTSFIPYAQFDRPFSPGLSIIDMMMFNSFEQCRELISQGNAC
ncbi:MULTISPECIES: WbqC family protein [unclassified Pseudomonas]|uniref:WbqC family protein n=1 Tax=unclassified Pseudomonas TaxID=196821 RepID=UPI00083852E3|nr:MULTISPECIES: WbqC family protein [unclassified Pseudomonas]QIH09982.1 WbqC family protein [Pseudomonas sp. BIOMIG1BAC]